MTMLLESAPGLDCDGADEETVPTMRAVLIDELGSDWARHIDHVATVRTATVKRRVLDDEGRTREETTLDCELLVLEHTNLYDPIGHVDPINVGNHRALQADWGSQVITYGREEYIAIDLDDEAAPGMTDVLRVLADSLILDDDEYHTASVEIIKEHWADYGEKETTAEVGKILGSELDDDSAELIMGMLREGWFHRFGDVPAPHFPSDPSWVDFGAKELAAWISARLGLVVTLRFAGRARVLDLRPRRLFAA